MNLLFAGNYKLDNFKIDALETLGFHVYIMEDERNPLPVNPEQIDAIVCNWLFVHQEISQFKNLKYVQLLSAGLDRMPIHYAEEHQIQVHSARGIYSIPMAEFAVCGVLQLIKQSRTFMKNQIMHNWNKQRNLGELSDKTVCVVGMGSVGHEVAKRFSVFVKEAIGVDLFDNHDKYLDKFYFMSELNQAIAQADIIVLTIPLTEETENLFDLKRFSQMKENSIIVNIARGKIIKETDLLSALKNGNIGGAVLDVYETEPLEEDNPIWDNPNIIATPHNSFVSDRNNERIWKLIVNNLKTYVTGENYEQYKSSKG